MTKLELCLRYGREHPLQVVMFQPLFEEYNRCRRLLCEIGRRLADEEIGLVLADLPGQGESEVEIGVVSFDQWRDEAMKVVAVVEPVMVASMRGGALLDDVGSATGRWRFIPENGARILRDLKRTSLTGEGKAYAGHALNDKFVAALDVATPQEMKPLRTVRLENDPLPADTRLPGTPLWRRAEPGEDAGLAAALATDLGQWTRTCAAS